MLWEAYCDRGCVVLGLSRAEWPGTVMCGDDSGLCFVKMTEIHVFGVVDEAEPRRVTRVASYDHHNEVFTESRGGVWLLPKRCWTSKSRCDDTRPNMAIVTL